MIEVYKIKKQVQSLAWKSNAMATCDKNSKKSLRVLFLERYHLWCKTSKMSTGESLLMTENNFVMFLSDEEPMLETLDYTIRIGSTPAFLYFDLYLYSAYATYYVYLLWWCHSNYFFSQENPPAGLKPTTSWSPVRISNHYVSSSNLTKTTFPECLIVNLTHFNNNIHKERYLKNTLVVLVK